MTPHARVTADGTSRRTEVGWNRAREAGYIATVDQGKIMTNLPVYGVHKPPAQYKIGGVRNSSSTADQSRQSAAPVTGGIASADRVHERPTHQDKPEILVAAPTRTSRHVTSAVYRQLERKRPSTHQYMAYLWLSNPLGAHNSSAHRVRSARRSRLSHSPSEPPSGLSDASTAGLQLTPSAQFDHFEFMQKLLQTTQVSQSAIVLSLHYVHRLKKENYFMSGQPGSEFPVAVKSCPDDGQ
ncbi:hypothetical protein JB92DRAFT_2835263 [Gautieria morchelliformis]|nr:hypothetical protein JB92DRAFT_2835263 [Gautieria morchelliformis]